MSGEVYGYRPQAAYEQTSNYEVLLKRHSWARELVEPMRRYDYATFMHMQRVAVITRDLPIDGKTPLLRTQPDSYLPESLKDAIHVGGLVHDVGKITVDQAILRKPASLSEVERRSAEGHVMAGMHMLAEAGQLTVAYLEVGHHAWQPNPYPFRGEEQQNVSREIMLGQQVLALADVVDVLLTDRPYQKAKGADYAYRELTEDFHFHEAYVEAALTTRQRLQS